MTWSKKIMLRYGGEFGVNIATVYNERGLARRVHTMNKVKHKVTRGHKLLPTISRDYKARITKTYKQVRDRAIVERIKRLHKQMNIQYIYDPLHTIQ